MLQLAMQKFICFFLCCILFGSSTVNSSTIKPNITRHHPLSHYAPNVTHYQSLRHVRLPWKSDESIMKQEFIESVSCSAVLEPIMKRREKCFRKPSISVDICVVFAFEYEYVIPFLVHSLALGFDRIFMYDNDPSKNWASHPTIVCLIQAGLVWFKPMLDEGKGLQAVKDCYQNNVLKFGGRGINKPEECWAAHFDVDEMLVLHNHTCVGDFVASFPQHNTSVIIVNMQFFMPKLPNSDFIRTNDPKFLSPEHLAVIDYPRPPDVPLRILPHDRVLEHNQPTSLSKSITRAICLDSMASSHHPKLTSNCNYTLVVDQDGFENKLCPWVARAGQLVNAQLNHYGGLNTPEYLRKLRRGSGGDTGKHFFWSSHRLFENQAAFVPDTIFHKYYGEFFKEIKSKCPRCFDTLWYELI